MCYAEQIAADSNSSAVSQWPAANSALLNGSSDDLWTDTEDESFIHATQAVLDSVSSNCFTSPLAVTRSSAVTSTPNVKSSRCRRTFCLDPAPAVPRGVNTQFLSSNVSTSSPVRDASFSEELMATLAEPDDVLDSQVIHTDAHVSSELLNPLCGSAVDKRDNTKTGVYVTL